MAKNRGHNEGTIYQRPDGRWCAQVSLSGRRLTHYAKTQRDCRDWLKETIAQVDSGLTIEGARTTLAEYLGKWLEIAKPSLRPNTSIQYTWIVRQYITPEIGSIRLKDLRPDHIQALLSDNLEAGVGVRTIQLIHAVLHRALVQALKWGLVGRNPADAVEKPRAARQEMRVLDPAQVLVLLNAAPDTYWEALLYLAVTTGLRQAELLGLCWTDLDWQTGELKVQRQSQYIIGQGFVFSEPKSAAGRRLVVLGDVALGKLRKHHEAQDEQRAKAGERWREKGLIFATHLGTPMHPRNLRVSFGKLLVKAGLPRVRFHDLRHTAATLMLQQGVHPKVVQERLGHANINLTLGTYSHVLPGMQGDAAHKLDTLLG